ncbi:MAG: PEP-CTERM sorting domain-containing protein [Pegethrix bostrychoides GSE-TBD4-15B]|uniref:PEP-CTERM sorting domain-containing protein n=1 Tax=Pegethrix bostrychoides GSE-TBD4-15B TaxID=2839662 RepID=A0A951P9Y6_9CYAN|nr:PEP-CTERM sorting domain-containing protein [Pegethrix bostrychoides GSE-TBD4-15B]
MNLKQSLTCVGLVTGTFLGAVLGTVAPAWAGSLTPSQLGLTSNSDVSGTGQGTYGTTFFKFDKDTTIKFNVENPTGVGSRGKDLNEFGFLTKDHGFTSVFAEKTAYNPGSGNSNDWLGTCNTSIFGCSTVVKFLAGVEYQLGLRKLPSGSPVYLGVGSSDGFKFNKATDSYYTGSNPSSEFVNLPDLPNAIYIGMEDNNGTQGLKDYQDWVLTAEAVPEPAALAGLCLVAGGMLISRRRRVIA